MALETEFKFTLEDVKAAALVSLKSKKKIFRIIGVLLIVIIALGVFLLCVSEDKMFPIMCIVIAVLYIPLVFGLNLYMVKQNYNANKSIKDATIHYVFRDEDFDIDTGKTFGKVRYEVLYSIVEDEKYILLKPSPRQMYIVKKEYCSDELLAFLHTKAEMVNANRKK
ncbi:YcxB family protein [Butyrivibrio sp. VCB2006]|uniref:YcxB family protein n=1 Tax=Butyrivibrio sp. VCB2006 TaxID=1280679 RepID=UPI0004128C7D|nr:YcxB family protein [Butyrivibrio sp. VCB2006]